MPHYGPLILPETAYPLQTLETSVVLAGTAKPKKQKRKQVVLDEDTYVKTLDTIITRDYFPALQPLESLLTGGRMRSSVTSSVRSSLNGSFEDDTPDVRPRSPEPRNLAPAVPANETKAESKLSLDQFTANFTSEDNEAFEQLIESEEKRREQRVFWVEEHAKEAAKNIINRLEEPKRTGMLDTWTYNTRNHLMFHPSGDEVTQYEPAAHLPQKEIVAENTRFPGGFFNKPTEVEEQKLKDAVPSTPMVGKYKLLRTPTPSIAAGEEILTWGDIIGTPLHLKHEDLPEDHKPTGREFRVPSTPARDELLHKLDAQSKERSKHLAGGARRTTTPGRSPQAPMSPAARAMLRSVNKGDPQLRASYGMTPTPIPFAHPAPRRPRGTPARTPAPTPSPLR